MVLAAANYVFSLVTAIRMAATPPKPVQPFFKAMSVEAVFNRVRSFWDPDYCCPEDRDVLIKSWKALNGEESLLFLDGGRTDPSRWRGVKVEGGRVIRLNWNRYPSKYDVHERGIDIITGTYTWHWPGILPGWVPLVSSNCGERLPFHSVSRRLLPRR